MFRRIARHAAATALALLILARLGMLLVAMTVTFFDPAEPRSTAGPEAPVNFVPAAAQMQTRDAYGASGHRAAFANSAPAPIGLALDLQSLGK